MEWDSYEKLLLLFLVKTQTQKVTDIFLRYVALSALVLTFSYFDFIKHVNLTKLRWSMFLFIKHKITKSESNEVNLREYLPDKRTLKSQS